MSSDAQYLAVKAQVEEIARKVGRDPQEVLIIGVSKTVGVPEVELAVSAGAHDFGENRPECLCQKAEALPQENWHFIGNVQSRAIPRIVKHACLIHSVYQAKHIEAINKAADQCGKVQDILLEVNISGEESKGGCTVQEAPELVELALSLENIRLRGLMTMAPQGDMECARQTFDGLSQLAIALRQTMTESQAKCFTELSMVMSEDWPEAIAAGATMVRVGRAIFSEGFSA